MANGMLSMHSIRVPISFDVHEYWRALDQLQRIKYDTGINKPVSAKFDNISKAIGHTKYTS